MRSPASVERAVEKANILYPVVLGNKDAPWNAYYQHYLPGFLPAPKELA